MDNSAATCAKLAGDDVTSFETLSERGFFLGNAQLVKQSKHRRRQSKPALMAVSPESGQ
jgi:hypothetical protein